MISIKHLLPAAALFAMPLTAFAAPTIGSVTPVTATVNTPVTLSASVSSYQSIDVCRLYVDLEDVGIMTIANGRASASFTFPYGGSRIAFVFCRDGSGAAAGANTGIWVEGPLQNQPPLGGSNPPSNPNPQTPPAPTPSPTSYTRHLLKLACAAGAGADDPCKAVYYIGGDGKRHAFPNSRIFFTWYANFDAVQTVSQSALSAFPLGKNVTYRPGIRMVKFTTVNKVYAVGRAGDLRWVKTEEIARTLYGAEWNKIIDDIEDSFFLNYTIGADINAAGDFNPTAETQAAPTID